MTTYHSIHMKLRTKRGHAWTYRCCGCRLSASHWAYDHAEAEVALAAQRQVARQVTTEPATLRVRRLCGVGGQLDCQRPVFLGRAPPNVGRGSQRLRSHLPSVPGEGPSDGSRSQRQWLLTWLPVRHMLDGQHCTDARIQGQATPSVGACSTLRIGPQLRCGNHARSLGLHDQVLSMPRLYRRGHCGSKADAEAKASPARRCPRPEIPRTSTEEDDLMPTTTQGDFGDLSAETEAIEVTTGLPQPDKSWRYTDRQGHEHYWDDGYPTLAWVLDGQEWVEDLGELVDYGHLACPLCDETIVPGTYIDAFRRFVPGWTTYKLNGEEITKERYEEILAARRPEVPRTDTEDH